MSNPIKSPDVAPVLQSMQDYICNHFTDELMDEVSAAVSLGLVEHLDMNTEGGKLVVNRNESKIIRTDFWYLDRTKLLADIKMRVKIGVSRDGGIPHYVVRYINFSAQFTLDGGITLHQGIRELTTCCLLERKLPKLSKYLVPVLSYDEMEIMVLQLLRKYRGEQSALAFQENGATELAQAMGLQIMRVSLYRNHHTSAIDASSSWTVTGDSRLTNLNNEGIIADADNRSVTIISADGTVLVQGESAYTITVDTYSTACDMTGAGNVSEWENHAVEF